jgi:hypothetical protein
MATTALQVYGVPGRTRTFAAKAESAAVPTPAGRIVMVQAEDRVLTVYAEDRALCVEG